MKKRLAWILTVCLTLLIGLLLPVLLQAGQVQPHVQAREAVAAIDTSQLDLPLIFRNYELGTVPGPDCAAIQQAIDALPSRGGTVRLAGDAFTCTAPIVIDRDNVDLQGAGPATVLRLADNANAPVLILGGTATPPTAERQGIHISDLTIDGNLEHQTFECWGGACDSGGLTSIRNNAITLRRVSDVVVARVNVHHARSGGIVLEKGNRRVTLKDVTASANFFDGLAAYETEDSLFSGLYLYDNTYAGISLDIDFNHNVISEAVLTGNGKQGIFLRDSRYNIFAGIQIRDSGEQGIFLAQVDTDVTTPALGNIFSQVVISGSNGAGLRANNASCVDNSLVGAQLYANAGGCVSEEVAGQVLQAGVICR